MDNKPDASSEASSGKGTSNSKKSSRSSNHSHQSTSRKATRRSNSDNPSASAINRDGHIELQERTRSVLSHPLGLALLLAFHDNACIMEGLPPWLYYFQECKDDKTYDRVLENAVVEWRKNAKDMREEVLTKLITEKINETSDAVLATHQVQVFNKDNKSPGRVDIMVSAKREADLAKPITGEINETSDPVLATHQTHVMNDENNKGDVDIMVSAKDPILVIEVGMDSSNWFGKLNQGVMYLKRMCSKKNAKNHRVFNKQLLLAIVTMDKESQGPNIDFQIGVFLCSRKKSHSNPSEENARQSFDDDFRMSLLWQSRTKSLNEASKLFGRTLMITQLFGEKRAEFENGVKGYEYLSSNCCKIQCTEKTELVEKVFRIYDHRFRKSFRSATVYKLWKPLCHDTVDLLKWDDVVVPKLDSAKDAPNSDSAKGSQEDTWIKWFSQKPPHESLQLISTPYREGRHFATFPTDFVPIIDQLQKLHDAKFVHGDIRAYNMVFGKRDKVTTPPEGWLIDFDFGGKIGEVFYPPGYNWLLDDGTRLGRPGQLIEKWHDWWALGYIIFHLHLLRPPAHATSLFRSVENAELRDPKKLYEEVTAIFDHIVPTTSVGKKEVEKMKAFFLVAEECDWTVAPNMAFSLHLNKGKLEQGTCPKATGSPPQKIR